MEIEFPIEFVVPGTPVSQRAKLPRARDEWKARVKSASDVALPQPHFASKARISMTLYYFAAEVMQGDIDNIIKPILDALSQHIYLDDQPVERLVIQRFEPDQEIRFGLPTVMLEQASQGVRPTLYVRISDDPYEDLKS